MEERSRAHHQRWLSTLVLYLYAVLLTRIVGTRSTAQMNRFDWFVAVGAGGSLATASLVRGVSVADGLGAFSALFLTQGLLTERTRRFS